MSRMSKAQKLMLDATRTPVEPTPLMKLVRLPIIDSVSRLKNGDGSVVLSSDVKSLEMRYYPKHSSNGVKQFLAHHAPEIAYANPSLPFIFTRLGRPSQSPNPGSSSPPPTTETATEPEGEVIASNDVSVESSSSSAASGSGSGSGESGVKAPLGPDGVPLRRSQRVHAEVVVNFHGAEPKSLKTRYDTASELLKKILTLTNTPLPARLSAPGSAPRPALLEAPEDIRRVPGGEGNEAMAQAA